MRKQMQRLNTLWFKTVTAFIFVLLLMVIILTIMITSLTERAFQSYVLDRSAYIQEVVPTLIVPSVPTVPPPPTIPPIPTLPPVPTILSAPELPVEQLGPEALAELSSDLERMRLEIDQQNEEIERINAIEFADSQRFIDDFVTEIAPSESELFGLQFLADIRQGVMLAAGITLLVAIVVATFLTKQITRPLTQLQQTSQTLAAGNLGARVPIQSKDELGNVAHSFNQMAQQLEKYEQTRRQMVADVAHELRTPLTVIKSNLEAMQDGLLQPTAQELGELQGEVERLAHMIDDLRLLSMGDAGELQLQAQIIDISSLIDITIERYAPFAAQKAIKLKQQRSPQTIKITGDSHKLQQALGNLLDNALHHTPTNGLVTVTVSSDPNWVHLSVADTGLGIAVEDLPFVFDRFWRGDKSRSRDSGGTGLGLSIVKQIVELHGGSIQVANLQRGTLFTLKLPLL